MDSVRGGDNATIETYEGHVWRFRTTEGTLVSEAKASSQPLLLRACRELYGARSPVLPLPLAQAVASIGPVVERYWQGERLHAALAQCNPWRFLSRELAFTGLHVLCLLSDSADFSSDAIAVFVDGLWRETPSAILPVRAMRSLEDVELSTQHALDFPTREPHAQPAAFFSVQSLRLADLPALLSQPLSLLYEGALPSAKRKQTAQPPRFHPWCGRWAVDMASHRAWSRMDSERERRVRGGGGGPFLPRAARDGLAPSGSI